MKKYSYRYANPETCTRRDFVKTAVMGGTALAVGLPQYAAWAIRGSGKGSVRLVFYTDVHARIEWKIPVAMQQAAATINARQPDLLIAGGDLITDGFQLSAPTMELRWDAYLAMHRAIRGEIFPVLGNHDLAAMPENDSSPAADPRSIYRQKLGIDRTYFSFDAVGYHFIILDSVHATDNKLRYEGRISHEQMEWLKRDLTRLPQSTPIVLAAHIPVLTAFYSIPRELSMSAPRNKVVANNEALMSLFKDHNLILVLQGHTHVHELIRWRRTVFITGGRSTEDGGVAPGTAPKRDSAC